MKLQKSIWKNIIGTEFVSNIKQNNNIRRCVPKIRYMKENSIITIIELKQVFLRIVGLEWSEEQNCLKYKGSNEVLERDKYKLIALPNEVKEEGGDYIDAVLMFGDGTLEYHLKNEEDAINWSEFSEETNIDVLYELKNLAQTLQDVE